MAVAALALAALGAGPGAGGGRADAAVIGIADQRPLFFADPNFQALKVKRSRYVVSWDAIFHEKSTIDEWLLAAQRQNIEPLIAFNHARGSKCPRRPCHLPSVRAYRRAFLAFKRRYPWVRLYQPWNEINSNTQPTWHRPVTAAAYYRVVRRACPRCTVLAGDFQDLANLRWYVPRYLAALGSRPQLWGFHNYGDINHHRFWGVRLLSKLVPGKIWLTETGAIYSFRRQSGKWALRPDALRAARSTAFLFKLLRAYSLRVRRAYIYQWSSKLGDRWDSGLVSVAGTPRRSLRIVRSHRAAIR